MTNSIVQLSVSVTSAPIPSRLQSTGALISQGATTLTSDTYSYLTQASDLTALLAAPLALSTMTWSGGTVTATTSASLPGLTTGDKFLTTIAGASPAGYNGTYLGTVTGSTTFTFALASNPGSETVPGTYTPNNQAELLAMVTTFFAQGSAQGVYVFELGAGDKSTGPAALATWIAANPGIFYSFLVPRGWDASSGLLALIAANESLTSRVYFFVTTTTSNYTTYTAVMKCVVALVEAPGIPLATEFTLAAPFQHALSYAPSTSNRMTPFAFSFLYGVTPYPTVGNGTLLASLKAANVNVVATGAEGGISTSILKWGTTLDGNDFTYWYSADWFQINSQLALANAVINGSNNPLAPLYYDQNGINFLQDVIYQTIQNGIGYGLANGVAARSTLDGPVFTQALDDGDFTDSNVVNAVPFITYVTENPSAYGEGLYGGLSAVWIPQRGFTSIVFSIDLTDLLLF